MGSRKIVPPMGPDCYNKLCWRLVPHRSGANYAVDRNLDRNSLGILGPCTFQYRFRCTEVALQGQVCPTAALITFQSSQSFSLKLEIPAHPPQSSERALPFPPTWHMTRVFLLVSFAQPTLQGH